jgi:hypothetical protein
VVYLSINCNAKQYPTEFQTYDEGWESLSQSLDHLRGTLGQVRYAQLVDMVAQAKTHYDAEAKDEHQGFLGSWLMQDIEQVVKGKSPFAYPAELYRWPR